jgi:hypothetical protein
MGWLLANAFLLVLVLVAVGYTWLAFFMLKLVGLQDYGLLVLMMFALAIVATYHTAKRLHRLIARFI